MEETVEKVDKEMVLSLVKNIENKKIVIVLKKEKVTN